MARGSEIVTFEDLKHLPTPDPTPSYTPISHYALSNSIKTISQDLLRGHHLISERYEIAKEGAQLFATLTFGTDNKDMGLMIGFRQGLDKSLAINMAIGSNVFVCSNLMFTAGAGGIVVMKKHSANLLEGLESLTLTTLYRAQFTFNQLIQDSGLMKNTRMDTDEAWKMLGLLYGHGLLQPRQLPIVHEHWLRSPHQAFNGENVFRFYQACTESMKSNPVHNTVERHIGLHSAIVNYCNEPAGVSSYIDMERQNVQSGNIAVFNPVIVPPS